MGWGNHHASYDEPCTQADVLAFRHHQAIEAGERRAAILEDDRKAVAEWLRLSRDMTQEAADVLWNRFFPEYRYSPGYYGPEPPSRPNRLPPTPVDRPCESPLWWATRRWASRSTTQ
jgi:hypothetical protein